MTFDDGILGIYQSKNIGEPGCEPVMALVLKDNYYYHQETLGYNRYYTALQAREKISSVLSVPDWGQISAEDICITEDGRQYRILLSQPAYDENGLKITRITLERLGESYAVQD